MRSYRKAFEEKFGKKISEEELDELFINDEMNNLTIFVPNFVLLRGEHEYYAEQKNIKIFG